MQALIAIRCIHIQDIRTDVIWSASSELLIRESDALIQLFEKRPREANGCQFKCTCSVLSLVEAS